MKLFAALRQIREFERAQLPFLKSIIDFDIVIEIGYAEEDGTAAHAEAGPAARISVRAPRCAAGSRASSSKGVVKRRKNATRPALLAAHVSPLQPQAVRQVRRRACRHLRALRVLAGLTWRATPKVRLRILVADDNHDNADSCAMLLQTLRARSAHGLLRARRPSRSPPSSARRSRCSTSSCRK